MLQARELIDEIRRILQPLDEKIVNHPYLAALESGQIPREKLRVFAGQQYHIITSDLSSIAFLLARHGHLPSRTFLSNLLQGEMAALEALMKFAAALGMSEDDLRAFDPLHRAHAYTAFVAWLALFGSDAELVAAFLVNFAAWGANCRRMSQALRERYGFTSDQVAFFDLFANVPPFEDEALSIVQAALDRGVEPTRIRRAAQLLQAYELLYWDAMLEAATSS